LIRIVMVMALLSFSQAAEARSSRLPPPPPPPAAPEAPQAPEAPRAPRTFQFVFPQLPQMPELPDFSEMEQDSFSELGDLDLPRLLADSHPGARRERDVDEDDDDDNDRDNDRDRDRDRDREDTGDDDSSPGVHVYKMNHDQQRITIPRIQMRDGDDTDERQATAQAKGRGSATLPVKGPITFQVRAQAGDLEVVTTDRPQVTVSVSDAPADEVALYAFGDRVEPSFRGRRLLRHGKLHVELPRGSRLDVSSMSGDVSAQRLGDVRIRTLSGDVKLSGVAKSDVQSISGDVRIDDAAGPVRLHLVSGKAVVLSTGPAPQVEFQSASGSLEWGGSCGRDCHLSAETVSGELRFAVDPRSSFELSYTSHSGELRDEVNLAVKRSPTRKHGMASGWLEATYGKGEGVIEADAFSGNLVVKKK
jgi:putative adhesin